MNAPDVASRGLEDPVRKLVLEREAVSMWWHADQVGLRYTATTLAKLPGLRVVLIDLREGEVIPQHRADADISVHVLKGAIALDVEGVTLELRDGELATIARGLAHDVEAMEDSEILLTLGGAPRRSADQGD